MDDVRGVSLCMLVAAAFGVLGLRVSSGSDGADVGSFLVLTICCCVDEFVAVYPAFTSVLYIICLCNYCFCFSFVYSYSLNFSFSRGLYYWKIRKKYIIGF